MPDPTTTGPSVLCLHAACDTSTDAPEPIRIRTCYLPLDHEENHRHA